MALGPTLIPWDLHLNLIASTKILLPNNIAFTGTGWKLISEGAIFYPVHPLHHHLASQAGPVLLHWPCNSGGKIRGRTCGEDHGCPRAWNVAPFCYSYELFNIFVDHSTSFSECWLYMLCLIHVKVYVCMYYVILWDVLSKEGEWTWGSRHDREKDTFILSRYEYMWITVQTCSWNKKGLFLKVAIECLTGNSLFSPKSNSYENSKAAHAVFYTFRFIEIQIECWSQDTFFCPFLFKVNVRRRKFRGFFLL